VGPNKTRRHAGATRNPATRRRRDPVLCKSLPSDLLHSDSEDERARGCALIDHEQGWAATELPHSNAHHSEILPIYHQAIAKSHTKNTPPYALQRPVDLVRFLLRSYQRRALFPRGYTPSDTQSDHQSPFHPTGRVTQIPVGKKLASIITSAHSAPSSTPSAPPLHSKFSHTLRHFVPNVNSPIGVEVVLVEVEVVLVGIEVRLGDAATM
jgi:hypothetical protein